MKISYAFSLKSNRFKIDVNSSCITSLISSPNGSLSKTIPTGDSGSPVIIASLIISSMADSISGIKDRSLYLFMRIFLSEVEKSVAYDVLMNPPLLFTIVASSSNCGGTGESNSLSCSGPFLLIENPKKSNSAIIYP